MATTNKKNKHPLATAGDVGAKGDFEITWNAWN
jgi:hypothetical protein